MSYERMKTTEYGILAIQGKVKSLESHKTAQKDFPIAYIGMVTLSVLLIIILNRAVPQAILFSLITFLMLVFVNYEFFLCDSKISDYKALLISGVGGYTAEMLNDPKTLEDAKEFTKNSIRYVSIVYLLRALNLLIFLGIVLCTMILILT